MKITTIKASYGESFAVNDHWRKANTEMEATVSPEEDLESAIKLLYNMVKFETQRQLKNR